MNSEPAMLKNGTLASAATALASNVFPQPGGPNNRAPLGTLAPFLHKKMNKLGKAQEIIHNFIYTDFIDTITNH